MEKEERLYIASKIKDLRKRKGITGRELAKILNISHSNLSHVEIGRKCTIKRYRLILNYFGYDLKINVIDNLATRNFKPNR